MKITKLFLFKNEKKTETKHPDLRLSGLGEDGNFYEIAALWKQEEGKKGFKGNPHELASIKFNVVTPKPQNGEVKPEELPDDF